MTWNDVNRGDVIYEIGFDDSFNVVLKAVTVINRTEDANRNVIILTLGNGSDITLTTKDFNRLVITEGLTIAEDFFYYPDKVQLINMAIDDIKDTKAIYDKSIKEVQENCIRLLDKKEELTSGLSKETFVSLSDPIKLGNSLYANISGPIVCFTVIDVDLDSIVAVSLDYMSTVTLNRNSNKFGDRFFLKDNITFYLTRLEAEVYERVKDIDHGFDNAQRRLEELTTESIKLDTCIKNLENYK